MKTTLAIHNRRGSFSDRWIKYCKKQGVPYKNVNGLAPDIMSQLSGTQAFLWHWHHGSYDEVLAARYVLQAAEEMGLKVFPDIWTSWSFDNKIGQKYQLEAIGAPLVPTYIFYDKNRARDWIKQIVWPKVFKLSRGAGSQNVRLIHNACQAEKLIKTAFSTGFKPASGQVRDVMGRLSAREARRRVDWLGKIKRFPNSIKNIYWANRMLGRDKGYVYFQEFIPDNKYDIRITVIGKRAFGFTRNVREGDFRASGSGSIDYDKQRIPENCIRIAFKVSERLRTQSVAYDFVIDPNDKPLIVETSYCYKPDCVYDCGGYWDPHLRWHEGGVRPEEAIIDDILASLSEGN